MADDERRARRSRGGVIAVHAGAGYHSRRSEGEYARALRAACRAAGPHLERDDALGAVQAAIEVLENVPCTNAGLGSNLTRDATVECDASAMAGDGSYGAVGAVAGIRNPIRGAVAVLQESKRTHPAGLVAPTTLVGDGARLWALAHGVPAAETADEAAEMHRTPRTLEQWERYMAIVRQAEESVEKKKSAGGSAAQDAEDAEEGGGVQEAGGSEEGDTDAQDAAGVPSACATEDGSNAARGRDGSEEALEALDSPTPSGGGFVGSEGEELGSLRAAAGGAGLSPSLRSLPSASSPSLLFDTVGAVAVGVRGSTAAGVSSGGVALKWPGRLGEAALYGAGCWARQGSVASTTGVGERVAACLLAREAAERIVAGEGGEEASDGEGTQDGSLDRPAGAAGTESAGVDEDDDGGPLPPPKRARTRASRARGRVGSPFGSPLSSPLAPRSPTRGSPALPDARLAALLRETVLQLPEPNAAGVIAASLEASPPGRVAVTVAAAHCARSMAVAAWCPGGGKDVDVSFLRAERDGEGKTLLAGFSWSVDERAGGGGRCAGGWGRSSE